MQCLFMSQVLVLVLAILALVKACRLESRFAKQEETLRTLAAKLHRLGQTNIPTTTQAPEKSATTPEPPPHKPVEIVKEKWLDEQPMQIKPRVEYRFEPPPNPPQAERPLVAKTPKPAVTLEERFGQAIIWIAGLSLALGVGYLVKFSYTRHLLSPAVRVSMGGLTAILLVAAGDWMRDKSNRIAQSLTAAGIAGAFAVLLAAMHVEHLIDQRVGFILMALTAAAAVALSLRQGPFVALLGLAGGFATPMLVGSNEHSAGSLFGYLFLLQMALVAVTRRRGWLTLMLLTLLAGYAWALAWLLFFFKEGDETAVGLFVLATSACFVLAPVGLATASEDATTFGKFNFTLSNLIRWAGAALGLVLMGTLLNVGHFTVIEWGFVWIISAGCVVVSRLDRRSLGLGWFSACAGVALLGAWLDHNPTGQDRILFGQMVLALGLLHAIGFYAALWKSKREGTWASASVLSALVYFWLAWLGVKWLPFEHFWGTIALVLAAVYALAGLPLLLRPDRASGSQTGLAALWVGACAFLCLAAPIELERQWIAVAWAVLTPMVLGIGQRLRVPALRWVGLALAMMVASRLLLNPEIFSYPTGLHPILNWISYGYGIPTLAMALAARMLWREKNVEPASVSLQPVLASIVESIAITLGMALLSLEVRHYFHPENLGENKITFHEVAIGVNVWFAMAIALIWSFIRTKHALFRWASAVIFTLSLGAVVLGLMLGLNPLWEKQDVGSVIVFNWLLIGYALPMGWCLIASMMHRKQGEPALGTPLAIAALVLTMVWLSMEMRHVYHGTDLRGVMTDAENYSYSALWLVCGTALLVGGILRSSNLLRWASIPVTMLAAVKVFVWDVRALPDLWRVVSFMGLGVVLLVLAYLYQRFVFRRTEA